MTNIRDLMAWRDAAGARYIAAVDELRSAFIDLGALDQALQNAHSGHPDPDSVRTFSTYPGDLALMHPNYSHSVGPNWQTAIQDRRDLYLK